MIQVSSNQRKKAKHKSLWTEVADEDSSQISGGQSFLTADESSSQESSRRRCRWVWGYGVVCETELGTITI